MKDYIEDCLKNGKYFFTKEEVLKKIPIKEANFRVQISRLAKKQDIQKLGHALYMIIPLEYQNIGSLPPEWIVDKLMKHLEKDYYIGLLTAASLHGIAHQQPMIFQVICNDTLKPIILSKGEVHFYRYKQMSEAQTEHLRTKIGSSLISTKEQTVFDLVRFYKKAGYFDNIATIIRDIHEELDVTKLSVVAHVEPEETVLQRLGYLFDILEAPDHAKVIEEELYKRKFYWIKLKPELNQPALEKVKKWKLIINDNIEFEE
ncbi:MAG TPA: type IV toxin-antitoxin system AbiEi family antitoxin [Candidatus Nitrosotenuis sp.]|jgi:predicted transcriptional regulator of viral defense system|nr:type IV toxin-antitoxin system AbiEi family antitoxin [Candidatus Nitrosotenuis sp.]